MYFEPAEPVTLDGLDPNIMDLPESTSKSRSAASVREGQTKGSLLRKYNTLAHLRSHATVGLALPSFNTFLFPVVEVFGHESVVFVTL